jgi:cation diffusion facilitator CzcD-associated flavoprotein CzcO
MDTKQTRVASYSQFACIGTGFSAIGLGATLKRWYGIVDIQFFERHSGLGGTWYINQYPGEYNCPHLFMLTVANSISFSDLRLRL